ncbi:MAG: Gfo/Idh/MocA family oxidoreductase [Gemmataceae bacterium]|nr:Gfo/Idh/MocA family oxidoreductase [Gemmataceae bacterium]
MNPTLDRRDFLTAGTAAAGTLAFSAGLYAQGMSSINVGIIGCGGRGSGALRDVLDADPEVKIAAICDLNEGRAKSTLRALKNKQADRVMATEETTFHGLEGYKKLLALPQVNYVILATPPGFRPDHLEAAVEAGKHIFTEKPVAVDVAGVRKCLDVARRARDKGLKIAAGTQRRHEAGYIEIMKRIHNGEIGDILAGRVYWNGTTPWNHWDKRRPEMSDVEYQLFNWYHFLWLSGDHIVEQHIHNIDVANWALRANPIEVTGMGGRSNRIAGDPNLHGNIFDHFAVELTYPGGVVIQSYCRQIDGCENNVSEAFVGTKGKTRTTSGSYIINGKDLDIPSRPYVQEHIDLVRAIKENKPLNELEQVTYSTFAAILGRMAAYSGQRLKWDEVLYGIKKKVKGEEVVDDRWFEDTMPRPLTLDMKLPADPVPVVGRWRPKRPKA